MSSVVNRRNGNNNRLVKNKISNSPAELTPEREEVIVNVLNGVREEIKAEAEQVANLASSVSEEEAEKAADLIPTLVTVILAQVDKKKLREIRDGLIEALDRLLAAPNNNGARHHAGPGHSNNTRTHFNGLNHFGNPYKTSSDENLEKNANNALMNAQNKVMKAKNNLAQASNENRSRLTLNLNKAKEHLRTIKANNKLLLNGVINGGASKKKSAPKKKPAKK
jgi:hypothetical protein